MGQGRAGGLGPRPRVLSTVPWYRPGRCTCITCSNAHRPAWWQKCSWLAAPLSGSASPPRFLPRLPSPFHPTWDDVVPPVDVDAACAVASAVAVASLTSSKRAAAVAVASLAVASAVASATAVAITWAVAQAWAVASADALPVPAGGHGGPAAGIVCVYGATGERAGVLAMWVSRGRCCKHRTWSTPTRGPPPPVTDSGPRCRPRCAQEDRAVWTQGSPPACMPPTRLPPTPFLPLPLHAPRSLTLDVGIRRGRCVGRGGGAAHHVGGHLGDGRHLPPAADLSKRLGDRRAHDGDLLVANSGVGRGDGGRLRGLLEEQAACSERESAGGAGRGGKGGQVGKGGKRDISGCAIGARALPLAVRAPSRGGQAGTPGVPAISAQGVPPFQLPALHGHSGIVSRSSAIEAPRARARARAMMMISAGEEECALVWVRMVYGGRQGREVRHFHWVSTR